MSGLALAPDGHRLVTTVATTAADGKRFVTALWELDPAGDRPPRRLTRSAPGESDAAFLPDGSLLFTSARSDPEVTGDHDDEVKAVWLLPAGGGEARVVATAPDYFPDENHWILKPSNARVWYETVLAFLDQHVLGRDWTRPSLL
jgi:dipeptidyl aminopeptidase/acylaminoacyl peptidase